MARWEPFAHEADIGVRGIGTTREEAFEQAALALIAVITDPQTVRPDQPITITCEAPDDDLLLAEWLNALVYEIGTRRMLFSRFTIRIEGRRLVATAWGERDRKSTRLNSSHSQISYAVFCLKKKKKKKQK